MLGAGTRIPASFVVESRVPVRVALERVFFDKPPELQAPIAVVDPEGVPPWEVGEVRTLLIDYSGSLLSELRASAEVVRVRGAGFRSLTYEAVVVLYELAVKRFSSAHVEAKPATVRLKQLRASLYVARKVLEALTCYDNYWLLEPSTVAFALRHALQPRGVIVDLVEVEIKLDRVEGRVHQILTFEAYDRRLRYLGRGQVVFDGSLLTITVPGMESTVMTVDPLKRVVCVGPALCVREGEEEADLEGVAALLGGQSE